MSEVDHPEVDHPEVSTPRLAFDVTFLKRRAFVRPTGIDRVQLEIATVLAVDHQAEVEFFNFDERSGVFEAVAPALVLELAEAMRGAESRLNIGSPVLSISRRIGVGSHVKRFLATRLAGWPEVSRHALMASGHSRRASQEGVRTVRAFWNGVADRRRPPADRCCSNDWTDSTTVFSLGMDFARYKAYLADRKSARHFEVALMVFDLIPIIKPQYATIEFVPFILGLLDLADDVLVISDATDRDLRAFATVNGRPTPAICKVPLGSALRDLERACPFSLAQERDLVETGFVLFVSTLTLRKNHHLLFDIWEVLLAQFGPVAVPPLVIAGQRGPVSAETQSRLDRTPEFAGVVHHVEAGTDAEIAWLYQNCTFTVYPSLYEGWGLPVSESHDFGKLCLASDRASLPEAGDGFAELLDPYDRSAWKDQIMHFWNDAAARCNREEQITLKHRRVRAVDTTNAILDIAGVARGAREGTGGGITL